MVKQLLLHKMVTDELERVRDLYNQLAPELDKLPTGSLSRKDEGLYRSCFEKGKQYMIKLNTPENNLIHQLKKRRYITKGIPILKKRIRQCESFLKADQFYDPLLIRSILPEQYSDLTDLDIFLEGDVNVDKWLSESYTQGQMYSENKKHLTAHGIKTRSKSEALIGLRLEAHNIPFRYEPQLKLGNRFAFPDFEILLLNTRKIIYWEHFGMLDDPIYVYNILLKLDMYAAHGIILGYNLIITFESQDRPLTLAEIDKKISYLLQMDLNPLGH